MLQCRSPAYQPYHVGHTSELSTGDCKQRCEDEGRANEPEPELGHDEHAPGQRWCPNVLVGHHTDPRKYDGGGDGDDLRPSSPFQPKTDDESIGKIPPGECTADQVTEVDRVRADTVVVIDDVQDEECRSSQAEHEPQSPTDAEWFRSRTGFNEITEWHEGRLHHDNPIRKSSAQYPVASQQIQLRRRAGVCPRVPGRPGKAGVSPCHQAIGASSSHQLDSPNETVVKAPG